MLYPQERMYEEMTFLSYYLHWSRDAVMSLSHQERRRWCQEVVSGGVCGEQKAQQFQPEDL